MYDYCRRQNKVMVYEHLSVCCPTLTNCTPSIWTFAKPSVTWKRKTLNLLHETITVALKHFHADKTRPLRSEYREPMLLRKKVLYYMLYIQHHWVRKSFSEGSSQHGCISKKAFKTQTVLNKHPQNWGAVELQPWNSMHLFPKWSRVPSRNCSSSAYRLFLAYPTRFS